MRLPGATEASAPGLGTGRAARRPLRWPGFRRGSAALSALAATVLAGSVIAGVDLEWPGVGMTVPGPHAGTAFLGTATCGDWQGAGPARRAVMVGALAAAATGPDPENPGATLSEGQANLLFDRACSTRLSRSFLLYEIYNRSAVLHRGGPPATAAGAHSGALGH